MSDKIVPLRDGIDGEVAKARLIAQALEREGAACIADLGSGIPSRSVVGFYDFESPTELPGPEGPATLQFSDFLSPLAVGEKPPENSWHDLPTGQKAKARYWRLLSP